VESKLGPLGTSATYCPIVPALGDCNGEFGGINGRGNWSTRRKPAPTPLCPPQIPFDQTRDWTRAAAVGSQRLTTSAMARPPGGITGTPDSWGIKIRGPGTPGWGSLESETVKFGCKSRGTRIQEWLRWWGPAAIVKTDLPTRLRGHPYQQTHNSLTVIKIWP
jgi:hypothetical protein